MVKALSEAEAHKGPSLVIAYSPCAMHGIAEGMGESAKDAKVGGAFALPPARATAVAALRRRPRATAVAALRHTAAAAAVAAPATFAVAAASAAGTTHPCLATLLCVQVAVETGYWPLFRFQPGATESEGKLTLDRCGGGTLQYHAYLCSVRQAWQYRQPRETTLGVLIVGTSRTCACHRSPQPTCSKRIKGELADFLKMENR